MIDYYEHIEAYIKGTLDADITAGMKKAMEADVSLRKAVENFPLAKSISGSLVELDVLAQLDKLDAQSTDDKSSKEQKETMEDNKESNTETDKPKDNSKLYAKILLLISIAGFAYMFYKKSNADVMEDKKENVIYAMGYERPIDPDAVKSANTDEIVNDFARGKHLFALNKFADAEKALSESLASTENSDTISLANYWLTHVYMNQEEWEKARKTVMRTQKNEASKLREILASMR